MKPPNAIRLRAELCPIKEVRGMCAVHHRHLKKVLGGLVGVRVVDERGTALAWGMISRPVSRHLQSRNWIEFTRGIVPDGAPPNCASLLLAFAAQWARKQRMPGDTKRASGRPICTYTLTHEPGTSLLAAGWVQVGETKAEKSWDRSARDREDRVGKLTQKKRRWVAGYCADVALYEGFPLSPDPLSDLGRTMHPERIALHTTPGRAVHLQKNVDLRRVFEVVDVGVGTATFSTAEAAQAFYTYITESPMAKAKTDTSPFHILADIPGVRLYYDYGHWHLSLRSQAEEDRLVNVSYHSLFSLESKANPLRINYSNPERDRRGVTTWSEGLWARDLKFVFPTVPGQGEGTTNLNAWGGTEFLPYAEAVLAHDLGLVETVDPEGGLPPGVRSVRLRGGTTMFVRRSTPLGTARAADGSWRLWLGDGEGWRPADGAGWDLWRAVAPMCFGKPIVELVDLLPGGAPAGEIWVVLTRDDDTLEPLPFPSGEPISPDAEYITMLSFDDTVVIGGQEILSEEDLCGADRWTVYMKETP